MRRVKKSKQRVQYAELSGEEVHIYDSFMYGGTFHGILNPKAGSA